MSALSWRLYVSSTWRFFCLRVMSAWGSRVFSDRALFLVGWLGLIVISVACLVFVCVGKLISVAVAVALLYAWLTGWFLLIERCEDHEP